MIEIEKTRRDEADEAVALVISQFEQHIFADYTEEGRAVIRGHIAAAYLLGADAENFTLVTKQDRAIVGVAKIRSGNHLSLLFVAGPSQRKGYGGSLLQAAITECKARNSSITSITASGSRVGLAFFLRHGFQAEGEEKHVNGLCFTPIRLKLSSDPKWRQSPPNQGNLSIPSILSQYVIGR